MIQPAPPNGSRGYGLPSRRPRRNLPAIGLLAAIGLYLILVLPTVPRQGINWDEQDDLNIASSYLEPGGLFAGSPADSLNVRAPMYLGSLLFRIAGGPDIVTARLLSCAIGALTLVGVWAYCLREFSPRCAVVACFILATSPYFLSYSMLAFTEGDVFIACACIWALVAISWLDFRPSVGRTVVAGLVLGLALSMKISALALFPALAIHLWLRRLPGEAPFFAWRRADSRLVVVLTALMLGGVAVGKVVVLPRAAGPGGAKLLLGFVAVTAVWLAWLVWGWLRKDVEVRRWFAPFVVCAVAVTTFFVVPPVHTTNPETAVTLFDGFGAGGTGFTFLFALEAVLFHFLVVLIKPSLIVGSAIWASLPVALVELRRSRGVRLLLLAAAFYGAFLLTLPWIQTRYMMPVFVLLVILLALALIRLWQWRRWIVLVMAPLALGFLLFDFGVSYPDLNLNGYQWLGGRYLAGRSSVGYRGIAQTSVDGVEQVVRWAAQHARPGQRVVTFLTPRHIVRATCPDPAFELIDGLVDPAALDGADYVLTGINAEIRPRLGAEEPDADIYVYPYDRQRLERDFTRVFSVRRAFGLEVASVWKRHKLVPVARNSDAPAGRR